jgi:hypothetical protein
MVRFELEGEKINLFAKGSRNGKEFSIVGESALKLSRAGKRRQLEKKVSLPKKHYGGECIPWMITRFALRFWMRLPKKALSLPKALNGRQAAGAVPNEIDYRYCRNLSVHEYLENKAPYFSISRKYAVTPAALPTMSARASITSAEREGTKYW